MRLWLSGLRVFGIRPGVSFRPDELLQKSSAPQRLPQGGFIYVISSATGHLKIGVTNDPYARLAQLQTASPSPLVIEYVGALRTDGFAIEAAAHATLANHRMAGEWFDCPADMAVAAVGAAAHRLIEPIASIPPARVAEVVRAVALADQIEFAKTKSWVGPWLAAGFVLWVVIFYFLQQFTEARSP
jgi:hypothetical protein